MKEFLSPTAIIDSTEESVKALAAELSKDGTKDLVIAARCFYWVRDQVRHSSDHALPVVTCAASEVLRHRAGFCYGKSHLLAALLRACKIPAGLCYQRLAIDEEGAKFCLHGLVAIHLENHGWYRVDPRGNKPGVQADFSPPEERLAFIPRLRGEMNLPARYPDALPEVVKVLQQYSHADEVARNLPDLDWKGTLSDEIKRSARSS